jgi:hypothetical protein
MRGDEDDNNKNDLQSIEKSSNYEIFIKIMNIVQEHDLNQNITNNNGGS